MARHLRLHLRFPNSVGTVDPFVAKLRDVFGSLDQAHNLGMTFEVDSSEAVNDGQLPPISIGSCTTKPSAQATALFKALAPANMTEDEVAVLFPRSLKPDPITNATPTGCAQCPPGRRGVIVSCEAPSLTLPHEIAHLFLGPEHDPSSANLMFRDPATTADPPSISPSQANLLRAGVWALPAAAPLVTAAPLEAPALPKPTRRRKGARRRKKPTGRRTRGKGKRRPRNTKGR